VARRPVLESAVMDMLWERDDWMTPTEVQVRLVGGKARTTVGTVLSRLHQKGRVQRRKAGNGFEYRAVVAREEYVASMMSEALDSSRDRPLALLEFIDHLPDEERTLLRRILRR
jgi:predicted transcriptional regulator